MRKGEDATTLYLHVFDWPDDRMLKLPGLHGGIAKAYLLAGGEQVEFSQTEAGATLELPGQAPDPIASVVCVELANTL